jgi:hypothetical protein
VNLTFQDLKEKTVFELRDIAANMSHQAVQGHTQMNKEHLLRALCTALGIDMQVHHQVVGVDKAGIKAQIRELKRRRDEAVVAHDYSQLKVIRRTIHRLNRRIHKATV